MKKIYIGLPITLSLIGIIFTHLNSANNNSSELSTKVVEYKKCYTQASKSPEIQAISKQINDLNTSLISLMKKAQEKVTFTPGSPEFVSAMKKTVELSKAKREGIRKKINDLMAEKAQIIKTKCPESLHAEIMELEKGAS